MGLRRGSEAVIKVRREDAIMSEDPPTDALEGVEGEEAHLHGANRE
jgi:hypothetical protein